jgi:hypothetical protein
MIHEIFFTKVSASIHKIWIEFSKQKITFQILLKPYFFLSIFCIQYSNMAWQKMITKETRSWYCFTEIYQNINLMFCKKSSSQSKSKRWRALVNSESLPSEARGRKTITYCIVLARFSEQSIKAGLARNRLNLVRNGIVGSTSLSKCQ